MAKQEEPQGQEISQEEMEKYNRLCSMAFSRETGARVEVELEPIPQEDFRLPLPITKSRVFGAKVHADTEASVPVPSKLIVKQYLLGLPRTSENCDTTRHEFNVEKAVLDLDINVGSNGAKMRIYPELYSREVPECNQDMIILREFIPGKTVDEVAREQLSQDGIKWEAAVGTPAISDSLYPIALLHVQTPRIASALKERGLFGKYEAPDEVEPEFISHDRTRRFIRYMSILTGGLGKTLNERDKKELERAFFSLDKEFVSKQNLLSIIDAELDVFTHHAMLKRLPDAGGVETGGIVRDLALYSAPIFNSLWETREKMPHRVVETYLRIRKQFKDALMYDDENKKENFSKEELALGVLFASVTGNIRKAAAVVHYNGREQGYPVAEEANEYLLNGYLYLDAFTRVVGEKHKDEARVISNILDTYSLRADMYMLVDKQGTEKRGSRRSILADAVEGAVEGAVDKVDKVIGRIETSLGRDGRHLGRPKPGKTAQSA